MPATKIFLSSSSKSFSTLDCTNVAKYVNNDDSIKYVMIPYVDQLFSKLEEVEFFL